MIFVFSLDDELSFSVLSGYYAKMAQYRKYISDIPVVLVAITGENDDHIISVYFFLHLVEENRCRFCKLSLKPDSISAAFSCPVYFSPREETSGKDRGLNSQTAAANRTYLKTRLENFPSWM